MKLPNVETLNRLADQSEYLEEFIIKCDFPMGAPLYNHLRARFYFRKTWKKQLENFLKECNQKTWFIIDLKNLYLEEFTKIKKKDSMFMNQKINLKTKSWSTDESVEEFSYWETLAKEEALAASTKTITSQKNLDSINWLDDDLSFRDHLNDFSSHENQCNEPLVQYSTVLNQDIVLENLQTGPFIEVEKTLKDLYAECFDSSSNELYFGLKPLLYDFNHIKQDIKILIALFHKLNEEEFLYKHLLEINKSLDDDFDDDLDDDSL